MAEKIGGGVVGEAEIGARERLIEEWYAYEIYQRTALGGIARRGDDVGASGEDCAGDFAVDGSEKSQLAFDQGNIDGAAAHLDFVDREDALGVRAQLVQRLVKRARLGRGLSCCCGCGRLRKAQRSGGEASGGKCRHQRHHEPTASCAPHAFDCNN